MIIKYNSNLYKEIKQSDYFELLNRFKV